MSDQAKSAEPVKIKLSTLLERVSLIAAGADKKGTLPGAEGYDDSTAPSESLRWCATILRIFLTRVIENVIETRKNILVLANVLRNPGLKEGDPWSSDLPAMRAELKELSALVKDIVNAIKKAQPPQEAANGEGNGSNGNGNGNGDNGSEPAPQDVEETLTQKKIDELAAKLAAGEKTDLSPLAREAPVAPVVPIKQ